MKQTHFQKLRTKESTDEETEYNFMCIDLLEGAQCPLIPQSTLCTCNPQASQPVNNGPNCKNGVWLYLAVHIAYLTLG